MVGRHPAGEREKSTKFGGLLFSRILYLLVVVAVEECRGEMVPLLSHGDSRAPDLIWTPLREEQLRHLAPVKGGVAKAKIHLARCARQAELSKWKEKVCLLPRFRSFLFALVAHETYADQGFF